MAGLFSKQTSDNVSCIMGHMSCVKCNNSHVFFVDFLLNFLETKIPHFYFGQRDGARPTPSRFKSVQILVGHLREKVSFRVPDLSTYLPTYLM